MTASQELLAQYVGNGSEAAFRELAERYSDLVYSTALRLVDGDAHRAEDIAQTVFIDLARMAGKLSCESMLGGWLHRHTCFVASTIMRSERRRQAREKHAVAEKTLYPDTDVGLSLIAPVLDEAIDRLGPDDRDVIVLRFFEQRSLRAVGEALGTSENVAQKRVSRAIEELRAILKRRGFGLSAVALGTFLSAKTVSAAPAWLVGKVVANALGTALGSSGPPVAKLFVAAKLKTVVLIIGLVLSSLLFLIPRFSSLKPGFGTVLGKENPSSAGKATDTSDFLSEGDAANLASASTGAPKPQSSVQINDSREESSLKPTTTPAGAALQPGAVDSAALINFVWIAPGQFKMGSPLAELQRRNNEGPRTAVTLTKGFWIGKTEVTLAQYQALTGEVASESAGLDPESPVAGLTWEQTTNFCHLMTEREKNLGHLPQGYVYRLPTEAEWEYACRAGTTTRFSFGDDPKFSLLDGFAWYCANSLTNADSSIRRNPQRVAVKLPNGSGLYDMHGNVAEWCLDWIERYPGGSVTNLVGTSERYHAVRGGGYQSLPELCRSATRSRGERGTAMADVGFRVALAEEVETSRWLPTDGVVSGTAVTGPAASIAPSLYFALPSGSKIQIDGDSTAHNWSMMGTIIGGRAEINLSAAAAQNGRVNARISAVIPVRSIKSGYDMMDGLYQEALREKQFPRITYVLNAMEFRNAEIATGDCWRTRWASSALPVLRIPSTSRCSSMFSSAAG